MSTMLNEEGYTFKELEKEIFRMVCEWGAGIYQNLSRRV